MLRAKGKVLRAKGQGLRAEGQGRRSEGGGRKSEVGGRASEIGRRRSDVRNALGTADGRCFPMFYRSHALRGNSFGRSGVQKETAGAVRKAPTQSVGAISKTQKEGRHFAKARSTAPTQRIPVMRQSSKIPLFITCTPHLFVGAILDAPASYGCPLRDPGSKPKQWLKTQKEGRHYAARSLPLPRGLRIKF